MERQLARMYFGGEALPVVVPIQTVAILGSFLGCPVKFMDRNTVWSGHIIEDPNNLPDLSFNPENRWWKVAKHLMECFVERAVGYHVAIPDLNGPTETLARLRGTEGLALDFSDNSDYIKPAIDRITQAWFRYWQECTKMVPGAGAKPTVEWMPLLKRVQDAGKLLLAYCGKGDVEKLLKELKAEGLMVVTSCDSVEDARDLLRDVEKWTAQYR
ncbi:hypothetical protein ES703_65688 [subsurface metagenome]